MDSKIRITSVSVTGRKCIQEQQYEPLEFTATVTAEITTNNDSDTKAVVSSALRQCRAQVMESMTAAFTEWSQS